MTDWVRTAAAAAALCLLIAPASAQPIPPGMGSNTGVTLNAGFLPDPTTISVTAGGTYNGGALAPSCLGFVPSQRASATVRYTADGRTLYFGATAGSPSADLTIIVRAPNGSFRCDDDSGPGVNPVVAFETPQNGRYDIWVGLLGAPGETSSASLLISEIRDNLMQLPATPPPTTPTLPRTPQTPDFTLNPTYGSESLTAGFLPDPFVKLLQAGGTVEASTVGANCAGWIARAPDFRLQWTAGSSGLPLIISVNASTDTTLVVNDAGGAWRCDDDSGEQGMNPSIRIENPTGGQYDIWVGNYTYGPAVDAHLYISEVSSQ